MNDPDRGSGETGRYLATLYLDVDGVVSPVPDHRHATSYRFQPLPWPDRRGLTIGLRPTEDEREISVPWSPSLITALDELREEFRLRLVWASSWLSGFPRDGIRILTDEIGGLRGGVEPEWPDVDEVDDEELDEDAPPPFRPHPKLLLVLADQEAVGGMPFIWIDDDGRPNYSDIGTDRGGIFGNVKRLTRGTPSLLIAPNRHRGITPAHINGIREWLARLPAS
jgi:hypothetical protein